MYDSFELIVQLIDFVLLCSAFIYGAIKLFKKHTPLYFQLYAFACGAMLMELLINVVLFLCGEQANELNAAKLLGNFSFSFFILSANFGTLDGIVDDKSDRKNNKAHILALIAPMVLAVLVISVVILCIRNRSIISGILLLLTLLPIVPASYYNLKHLLLPTDQLELLKATYRCNIFALAFHFFNVLYFLTLILNLGYLVSIVGMLAYASSACLIMGAVWGRKQWKI